MAVVFYYIPKESSEEIIKRGINVSQKGDRQIVLDGETMPCIMALLSPRDDISKYDSDQFVCLEIDINIKDGYVLNGDLNSLNSTKEYYDSAISLERYKFGTYRMPEIAVVSDISVDKISLSSKKKGTPILFETSDKLYKGNLLEELRLRYKDFDETLLGIFFMMMVSKGKMKLLGQKRVGSKTVYIYQDSAQRIYTLDIQEG